MEIVPYKSFRDLWVFREIASGGMSVVYLALDPRQARFIALKTLLQELWEDPEHRARFQREVTVQESLNHPHIVRYYDGASAEDGCFLATEYLRGESLDQVLRRHPKGMPVSEVIRLLEGLTAALFHAHSKQIVHRDIQPRNIILEDSGGVKLFDFGIALTPDKLISTKTGTIMGTFAYSSPEQNQGREVDDRSDLYSLGLVMHELLTGQRAIQGSTLLQITEFQLRRQLPPPGIFRHDIPEGLSRLVHQMVQRWPEERPKSARHVLDALIQLKVTASEEERRLLEPDEVQVQLDLARRVLHGGRLRQALERARKAEAMRPGDGPANVLQGRIHALLGEAEAAEACFEKAWHATPDDPGVAVDQALALLRLGRPERVLELSETSREHFGPDPLLQCLSAYVQAEDGLGIPGPVPTPPRPAATESMDFSLDDFELDWEDMGMPAPTPPPPPIPESSGPAPLSVPVQLPSPSEPETTPSMPAPRFLAGGDPVGPAPRQAAPPQVPLTSGGEAAPTMVAGPALVRKVRDWQKTFRSRSPALISLAGLLFPGVGPLYLGHWGQGGRRLLVGLALVGALVPLATHPTVTMGRPELLLRADPHLLAGWILGLAGLTGALGWFWLESSRCTHHLLQEALAPPIVEAVFHRDGHTFLVSHGGACLVHHEYMLLSGGPDPARSGRWLGDACCVEGGQFRAVHRFVSPTGDEEDLLGAALLPRTALGASDLL